MRRCFSTNQNQNQEKSSDQPHQATSETPKPQAPAPPTNRPHKHAHRPDPPASVIATAATKSIETDATSETHITPPLRAPQRLRYNADRATMQRSADDAHPMTDEQLAQWEARRVMARQQLGIKSDKEQLDFERERNTFITDEQDRIMSQRNDDSVMQCPSSRWEDLDEEPTNERRIEAEAYEAKWNEWQQMKLEREAQLQREAQQQATQQQSDDQSSSSSQRVPLPSPPTAVEYILAPAVYSATRYTGRNFPPPELSTPGRRLIHVFTWLATAATLIVSVLFYNQDMPIDPETGKQRDHAYSKIQRHFWAWWQGPEAQLQAIQQAELQSQSQEPKQSMHLKVHEAHLADRQAHSHNQ